eukprot:1178585-Prorocentrum_minimum.AAC.1
MYLTFTKHTDPPPPCRADSITTLATCSRNAGTFQSKIRELNACRSSYCYYNKALTASSHRTPCPIHNRDTEYSMMRSLSAGSSREVRSPHEDCGVGHRHRQGGDKGHGQRRQLGAARLPPLPRVPPHLHRCSSQALHISHTVGRQVLHMGHTVGRQVLHMGHTHRNSDPASTSAFTTWVQPRERELTGTVE